jgi:cell division transport system permease protein
MKQQNTNWARKKWGSYPSVAVIFNITIALSIAGFLGLLFLYANELSASLRENLEVKLYLRKDLSEAESMKIRDKLVVLPFLKYENEQPAVRYVSGEEAEKILAEKTGEDFRKILEFRVLPGTYFLKIRQEYAKKEAFAAVANELGKIEGVAEVALEETSLNEINDNLQKLAWVMLLFTLIFATASVILIDNAVKLALYSQRFLIRSMQLVGAESDFIQKPYLQNAALNGVAAGIAASILAFFINLLLRGILDEIALPYYKFFALCFLLVLCGVLISSTSTYWAVKKYLSKSLDDLF